VIVGPGEIDIKGDDYVMGAYTNLRGGVTLANYGNTTFFGVHFDTTPWADDQVTIDNQAGAIWTDVGSGGSIFAQNGGAGTSAFINSGTFVEDTATGVIFDMAVINDDVIEAGPSVSPSVAFSPSNSRSQARERSKSV
jgi:hypothetical protein